ncbi:hypothetical protein CONPUDRAFT_86105 [Coniophora puteana RWD-64-598 SS2]|uniref:Uncharacterized protein n=1 Tax=Coniophora puteana (strain RWD-64-598) TaxID=741705 RepID=R7SFN2_CONPW|nr:uncharacterized protein CONPUDRAFT_86105 [Coniophora puteana RWD-64-598 SS2]EIW73894.1 hypothetical protein CONPUDRAFT_86105 [Coniophora puteana RWD-64-598 SS2]
MTYLLGMVPSEWETLKSVARPIVKAKLDINIKFCNQPADQVAFVVAKVIAKIRWLDRYVDAWPVEMYIHLYLMGRAQRQTRRCEQFRSKASCPLDYSRRTCFPHSYPWLRSINPLAMDADLPCILVPAQKPSRSASPSIANA